jgi:hypothetical protein
MQGLKYCTSLAMEGSHFVRIQVRTKKFCLMERRIEKRKKILCHFSCCLGNYGSILNRQLLATIDIYFSKDKLKLIGQNLARGFNYRLGRSCISHAIVHISKQPNLKLKTWPKQLLGSLPLAFIVPDFSYF